jgi:NADH-quinone oxidoreductase subunit G
VVREGWNGWNVMHNAAARVGGLDLGLTVPGGVAEIVADHGLKALFLLGADEVETPGGVFTVYIGTHGDRGVRHADVILPGAAYTEKSGTWVNMEGRVQRGLRAVFPPGEAREDWTILRALSSVLGAALPYDDLGALRARIGAEWGQFGTIGGLLRADPDLSGAVSGPVSGHFEPVWDNYYQTNPIARASETMAACVQQILGGRALEAAE